MTEREQELYRALCQAREGLCAGMRVIARIDLGNLVGAPAATQQEAFLEEARAVGLENGFGKRIDVVIKKYAQET